MSPEGGRESPAGVPPISTKQTAEQAALREACGPFSALPSELLHLVLGLLPPNEVACTVRLVCKAAAAALSGPQHATVRLSQPAPHAEFARRWGCPLAMRPLRLKRRRLLLHLTGASGDVANLQVAALQVGFLLGGAAGAPPTPGGSGGSGGSGAAGPGPPLDPGWWMRGDRSIYVASKVLEAAVKAGRRPMIEWIIEHAWLDRPGSRASLSALFMFDVYCVAALSGHTGLMKRLRKLQTGPERTTDLDHLLACAAFGCDLRTLQQLHRTHVDGRGAQQRAFPARWPVIGAAAASATPDWQAKVEWLEGRGTPRTDIAYVATQCVDAPDRLAWLRDRGYSLTADMVERAARSGNVATLQYLLAEGVPVSASAMTAAAESGQLPAMQVLHAHGCAVPPGALQAAARAGSLPAVSWALGLLGDEQQRAVLGVDLMNAAARSGCLELVARLRELGCPWSWETFTRAAEAGSQELLEWLAEQGCPMGVPAGQPVPVDMDPDDPYLAACGNHDWLTLACLHRLGCPWYPLERRGGTFSYALRRDCHIAVLRRLLELGCPVDWRGAREAAEYRDDDAFSLLKKEDTKRRRERRAGGSSRGGGSNTSVRGGRSVGSGGGEEE